MAPDPCDINVLPRSLSHLLIKSQVVIVSKQLFEDGIPHDWYVSDFEVNLGGWGNGVITISIEYHIN